MIFGIRIQSSQFIGIGNGIQVTGSIHIVNLESIGHPGCTLRTDSVKLLTRCIDHSSHVIYLTACCPVEISRKIKVLIVEIQLEASRMTRHHFAQASSIIQVYRTTFIHITEFGSSGECSLSGRQIVRVHVCSGQGFRNIGYTFFQNVLAIGVIEIIHGIISFADKATYQADRFPFHKHIVVGRNQRGRTPV